ncbi:MAG: serine dehydratase beta chain, partial [Culicoidibacterales bacterium]
MQSLRQLYKIGRGPSSSHTMGPERAALSFQAAYANAHAYRVHLYGSLAATGIGHLTDWIIHESL